MKKNSSSKSNTATSIIGIILMFLGIGIFLYPSISNYFAEKNQSRVIDKYEEAMSSQYSKINIEEELKKADLYNESLTGNPLHDPFATGSGYTLSENYFGILNIDGVIGYIEIPKISIKIPIYHGTSDEVLQKGVGHVESTSFPIGGLARHSILVGHRGLPSAKLFTDLNKLVEGDYFYIHVLDRTLAYKVYDIETIEPEKIGELNLVNDKDLVTLITCTPYGINTHRLLVHAERTEYIAETDESNSINDFRPFENRYIVIGIIIGVTNLIIIIVFVFLKSRTKGKRRKKRGKEERRKN